MNETVPVGVPLPAVETVAVKVTTCPYSLVASEAASAVVVFVRPLLTDWTTVPLLFVKFPSPP